MKKSLSKITNKLTYKSLLSGLFVLMIFIPGLLTVIGGSLGRKLDVELGGFFDTYEKPEFSLESFWNGDFQDSYTTWFANNFSPRGILIEAYNTVRYSLFNRGVDIVGEDDYLFEQAYVDAELCLTDANNMALEESRTDMENYVSELEAISDALEAQDKHLILYITPSKADLYRDRIPSRFLENAPSDGVRPIDYLLELLSESDVNYLNTIPMAADLETPAFYAAGTHWSRPYEQTANAELLKQIGSLTGLNYRSYALGELQSSSEPYERDQDLWEMMNVWNSSPDTEFYSYELEPVVPENYDQLNILTQGGSFSHYIWRDMWSLFPDANIQHINYCEYTLDCNGTYIPISSWDDVPIDTFVENADCVVIELNEGVITNYSNGFVDYLYDYLTGGNA